MDTLSLGTFQPLTCPCGSESFVKVLGLSSRAGTGTTETVKGYACQVCQQLVDFASMQQALELRLLEAEVRERQARMRTMRSVNEEDGPRASLESVQP